MGEIKGTVTTRMQDDAKLYRTMATMELQTIRGFGMQPETTFHQSKTLKNSSMSMISTSK